MSHPDPFWVNLLPTKIRIRVEGRHTLFAVLHNSGWLMADKVFKAIATIVVGAWVARYLGPTDFGKLSFVLAIVAFFQVVSTLGLDGIVVSDIVKNKEGAGLILGTTLALRLLAGGLVMDRYCAHHDDYLRGWRRQYVDGYLHWRKPDLSSRRHR